MSNIDTIKDALAVLESIEAAKQELVQVQAEYDRMRDANEELAAAQAKAIMLEEENRSIALDAKLRAEAVVRKANNEAEKIVARADAEYQAKLATMDDKVQAEIDKQQAELNSLVAITDELRGQALELQSEIKILLAQKYELDTAVAAIRKTLGV